MKKLMRSCLGVKGISLVVLGLGLLAFWAKSAMAEDLWVNGDRLPYWETEVGKYWLNYWDNYSKNWWNEWDKAANLALKEDPRKRSQDLALLARIVGLDAVNNETGTPGINPMNGALLRSETDLNVPGRSLDLGLTRTYNNKIWRNGRVFWGTNSFDNRVVLGPFSYTGLGWQFHMGRAWQDSNEYVAKHWVFETTGGVKYQLQSMNQLFSYNTNRYWRNYRSFDGSGVRLVELGSYQGNVFTPDTIKVYTGGGTCYVMNYKQWDMFWNNDNPIYVWYPTNIKDRNGNYHTIEYGNYYHIYSNLVYITRIIDSCNREFRFYVDTLFTLGQGDTTAVLDSLRTTDSNGQTATYKYHYMVGQIAQIPFDSTRYFDTQRGYWIYGTGQKGYPLLKSVIFPNGDSISYSYNSYLELNRIVTPQQGKTTYAFGEYRFKYYSIGGDKDSTYGVRCVTAESSWAYPTQPQPNITSYQRIYRDASNPPIPLSNPDTANVIDACGNQTSYYYCAAPFSALHKYNPYGRMDAKNQYSGNGGSKVPLNRKAYEWIYDQDPYGNYYQNLRVSSETLSVYGTNTRHYVTRYRNYDAFLIPQRIDQVGDVNIPSGSKTIFKEYLHDNGTSTPWACWGNYKGNQDSVQFRCVWSSGRDAGKVSKIRLWVSTRHYGGSWSNYIPVDSISVNPASFSGQWLSTKCWSVSLHDSVRAQANFITDLVWSHNVDSPHYGCHFNCPPPPGGEGAGGGGVETATVPDYTWGLNSYADQNILGLVTHEKVTSDTIGTNILSEAWNSFDDTTRIIQGSYSPAPAHYDDNYNGVKRRGLVTMTTQYASDPGGGQIYYNAYQNYDQCGSVVKTIDANNHETRYYYAPDGNPSQYQYAYLWKTELPVSSGVGTLVTYRDYDFNTGLLTVGKDPNGNETHYAYDNVNRLRKVAGPGDWTGAWPGWSSVTPSVVYTYKSALNGYPSSTIDSVKMNTTPQYTFTRTFVDGFGRTIQALKTNTATSDSSIVQNVSYNPVGLKDKAYYPYKVANTTSYVTPDLNKPCMQYTYDALGRNTKKKHSALSDSTVTTYDDAWFRVTDPNSHLTSYHRNSDGQVDTVNAPMSANTYYSYDPLGRLLQVQDAAGKQTKYRYDYLGRLRAVKSPDATSSYSYSDLSNVSVLNVYDSVGNVRFKKNGENVTECRYDELNRLTGVWNNSTQKAEFDYDVIPSDTEQVPTGLNNPLGKLTRIKDLNPTVENQKFFYDTRGRLGQRSIYLDALSKKKVKYTYNPADVVTGLTYPDNTTVSYTYDLLGQVTGIPGYLSSVKYNASLQPTSMPFGDGTTTTINYDTRQRPLTLATNYSMSSLTYVYNHNLVSQITDNLNGSRTQSFQYNDLEWVTNMSGNSHSESYTYYLDGNFWTYSRDGNSRTYNYTSGSDLLSSTSGFGAYNFSYDSTGNVKAKGSNTFTYDYNNLLVSANINGRTITNSYDPSSQRVKKVDSQTGTSYYIYEGLDVIAELNASGTITAKHVYGIGQHIAMVDANWTHFYHNDVIGSVRAISRSGSGGGGRGPTSPVKEKEYGYYPFGDSLYETGTLANKYKFGGKEMVPGIPKSYDFSARFYDAEIGRFYSVDPIIDGVISPYAYCVDNPLKFVDPTGMKNEVPVFDYESYAAMMGSMMRNPGRLFWGGTGLGWVYQSGLSDASNTPFRTYVTRMLAEERNRRWERSYQNIARNLAPNPRGARGTSQENASLGFFVGAYFCYQAGSWVIDYTLFMMYSSKLMELNYELKQSYMEFDLYGSEIRPGVWVNDAYILMESQRLYPEMWGAVGKYGRGAVNSPSSSPGRWIRKP